MNHLDQFLQEEMISYSDKALNFIKNLSDAAQKVISEDLVACYAKSLENMMSMQIQSYWSDRQSAVLGMLTKNEILVHAGGYTLKVSVCHATFCWHVLEVEKFSNIRIVKWE